MLHKERNRVTGSFSYTHYHSTLRFFYYNQHVEHTKTDKQQDSGKGAFVYKGRDLTPTAVAQGSLHRGQQRHHPVNTSPGNDNTHFCPYNGINPL